MQNIVPFLWFENQAEEAAEFYTAIFKDFKNTGIKNVTRNGESGTGPKEAVMTVTFEINGQEYIALNGRPPQFQFSMASSQFVKCDTQDEVDYLWEKLTEGGTEIQCGWLTDKYGVAWQIVPVGMWQMVNGKDPKKVAAAMQAMYKMKKLDLRVLQQAYDNA